MLFGLSKVFWTVFNPGALLVIAAALGGLFRFAPWRRVRRLGSVLVGATIVSMLAIAVLPLGAWLILPLEERFPRPEVLPAQVDGIVVLGGAIDLSRSTARGEPELNDHAERMIAFAALARRYPEARLIFTGGSGALTDRVHREADYAVQVMSDLGIAPGRVRYERESRNTAENARFTMKMAAPKPGERWLLVTSASHMPRAVGAFRHVGWRVIAYPVDYFSGGPGEAGLGFDLTGGLDLLTLALHEWIGLAAYRMLGWSDSLFPGPEGATTARRAPVFGAG
jgi:uncharacterized SAM-binding protein YcdF (DUF218 family)